MHCNIKNETVQVFLKKLENLEYLINY